MGVRLTSVEGKVAMFDSTSGWAFGPVSDEGTLGAFVDWMTTKQLGDPRALTETELEGAWLNFCAGSGRSFCASMARRTALETSKEN